MSGGGRVGGTNPVQERHAALVVEELSGLEVHEMVRRLEARWKRTMPNEALFGIVAAMAEVREQEETVTRMCIACAQGMHRRVPCREPEVCPCRSKACRKVAA